MPVKDRILQFHKVDVNPGKGRGGGLQEAVGTKKANNTISAVCFFVLVVSLEFRDGFIVQLTTGKTILPP